MDASELKVVLSELHRITDERIVRITNEGFEATQRAREAVCESHGGHEFVASDGFSRCCKLCKFCGKADNG